MEVVELFGLDQTVEERQTLKVLPGAKPHGMKIYFSHLVKNVLAWTLPIKLALLRVGVDDLIEELPDDLLECLVI